MKILCLIRQVPDAEARVKTADGAVDLQGSSMALDGMDEYGVEQALRMTEGGAGTVAVAVGPQRFEDAIRRTLAMGLERAIHVETDLALDVVTTARLLKAIALEEQPDLIFVGGQHADTDSQAMGAALAEALGWNLVTWTTELTLDNQMLKAVHDVDDGKETVTLQLPCVVTTQQGLNEPRYPTLPNIMKAKKKTLENIKPEDLGVDVKPRIKTLKVSEPPKRSAGIKVADVAALVDKLKNEAKVI